MDPNDTTRLCIIDGCSDKHWARGWCRRHYKRWLKRGGDPSVQLRTNEQHGMVNTSEWLAWCRMKSRCLNPDNPKYHNYGGRGINVDDEWQKSFLAFYNHIGPKPSPDHSLDRIDNDGNYEPGNVRWATKTQQNRNRRKPSSNKVLTKNI